MRTFLSFKKPIGIILLPFFIFTSVFTLEPLYLAEAQPAALSPAEFHLKVPVELGKVEEVFNVSGGEQALPTVIIQDAHMNYDAQMSEAKLFRYLTHENSYSTLFLEGLFGILDARVLKHYPERNKVQNLTKGWMRKGIIKGGEYFDINLNEKDTNFVGLEDKSLYKENHNAYLALHNLKTKAFKSQYGKLRSAIQNLKAKIFSKELKKFDGMRLKHARGDLSLHDYLLRLKPQTGLWNQHPQIKTLLDVIGKKEALSSEEKMRIQSLSAKQLFDELEVLEQGIVAELSQTAREEELFKLVRAFELLDKGLNLELSRVERKTLAQLLPLLSLEKLPRQFEMLGLKISISSYIGWDQALMAIMKFYQAAEAREEVFVRRIQKSPESVVLVGGYHTIIKQARLWITW